MRGEGSAARRRETLVEDRLAAVTFDGGRRLRLRPQTAGDAANDGAQRRGRWRGRCHRLSSRRRRLGLGPTGDLDRASERAHHVDQRRLVGRRGDRFERPVALDRLERVPPHQSLVEPMPERLADAEPVGHALDDEAVGDPRGRRPAIEQVERVVEQVMRFEGRREPRADRDDIGPIGRPRRPGRVEDHAQTPGHRRRRVSGRGHEGQTSPAIEHGKRCIQGGFRSAGWEPVSYPNAQPRNAEVTASASSARQAIAPAERPGPWLSGFRARAGPPRRRRRAGDRQGRQTHRGPRRPAPAGHLRALSAIRLPAQPRGPDARCGADVRRHPDRDRSVRGHRRRRRRAADRVGRTEHLGRRRRACLPTAASPTARTRPSRSSWSPSTDRTRRWRSARTTSSWRPTGRPPSWSAGSAPGRRRPSAGRRRLAAYVIQDFEPGFFPWSAQWMLARATYDAPARDGRDLQHVSSCATTSTRPGSGSSTSTPSSRACSRRFARRWRRPPCRARRTIVVYGRPGMPRNAFPAIVDGLRAWRASDPNAADWTVVSVGEAHPDVDLGGGAVLRSIGKLDLDAYAALLRELGDRHLADGLAPPELPAARDGAPRDAGADQRLRRQGPVDAGTTNIRSVDRRLGRRPSPSELSALCRRFEADPGGRGRGVARARPTSRRTSRSSRSRPRWPRSSATGVRPRRTSISSMTVGRSQEPSQRAIERVPRRGPRARPRSAAPAALVRGSAR